MTARPEVDRLEDLLNELGWAYIEVGTGASDMQTSDDVERLTKEITDMFASLRGMREALKEIDALGVMEINPSNYDHELVCELSRNAAYAASIARAALSGIEPGDEQARPSASAPASTLSKDKTK